MIQRLGLKSITKRTTMSGIGVNLLAKIDSAADIFITPRAEPSFTIGTQALIVERITGIVPI